MLLYSGEYDILMLLRVKATLGRLKNLSGQSGIRTCDLWNTSPTLYQLSYTVKTVRSTDISKLTLVPLIPNFRRFEARSALENFSACPVCLSLRVASNYHIHLSRKTSLLRYYIYI